MFKTIRKLVFGIKYYKKISTARKESFFFRPWKNPYLLWRFEVVFQMPPGEQGFWMFYQYAWRYRKEAWRFLDWAKQMESLDNKW